MHSFFYVTHIRELGQKYKYILVQFLVQMKTPKFAFKNNWPLATTSHSSNKDLSMELLIIRTINVFHFRKSNSREGASSQASRDPKVPPSVMPNIHPRPNLHAQHHNLDTLERLVFEDFNGSPYTSKSTIVINGWESICCNFKLVRRKFEFVDPRGYINIAWLSIQVKQIYFISIGYLRA